MMAGGATAVWLAVAALAVYAVRGAKTAKEERLAKFLIIGGGAVVPTVVLAVLLVYGLAMLPGLVAPRAGGSLKIAVSGEQWWWRVRYQPPDGGEVSIWRTRFACRSGAGGVSAGQPRCHSLVLDSFARRERWT